MCNITKELVKQLIEKQFPQWSNLSITPVQNSGHDNRTFHLGDKMTVRMPSGINYAPQVEKEIYWLPKLQPYISLIISNPIKKGESTSEYPYPWSINLWIEGDTVNSDNVKDLNKFASDLALFLKELQSISTEGGPVAGKHNFYRGGDLSVYDNETQEELENLDKGLPKDILTNIWNEALASKWEKSSVWVHGDIAQGNLLVKDDKLCAVIDFGILGVGDPSCDYAIAWTFFDKESRETFFKTLECDNDTINRARGWALWKALITYKHSDANISNNAKNTVKAIIEEYRFNKK